MMRPRSSWLAISRSNHLRKMVLRSLAVLLRQAGQAALAAAIACSVSRGPRLATSTRCWPVAGSCTAKRLAPLTHWPLISASVLSRLGSFSWARVEVFMSMGCLQIFNLLIIASLPRKKNACSRYGIVGASPTGDGVGGLQAIACRASSHKREGNRQTYNDRLHFKQTR